MSQVVSEITRLQSVHGNVDEHTKQTDVKLRITNFESHEHGRSAIRALEMDEGSHENGMFSTIMGTC